MTIAVCVKWSLPPSGEDERFAGISLSDQAALEIALSIAEARNESVRVVSVAPPAAERALRDAVACGAVETLRIDTDNRPDSSADAPDSAAVATLLAEAVADCSLVVCGDYSIDRGSGSVPAFVAALLGIDQALGLVAVDVAGSSIEVVRRLDGARREILRVEGRAVLSVEGSVTRLRRAPLRSVLAADRHEVKVRSVSVDDSGRWSPDSIAPFRPRARVLPAPAGSSALDRVRLITDAGGAPSRGETVELSPDRAAARIIDALREWGYLSPDVAT